MKGGSHEAGSHIFLANVWLPPSGGSRIRTEAKQDGGRAAEPYNRVVTRAVVFTCIAAIVVFAVVQDRLTSAAVGRYVTQYREAAAGGAVAVTIDEVMKPAVAHAAQQGAFWSGAVLVTGLGGMLIARRRRVRE